jgi:hypothetical protein
MKHDRRGLLLPKVLKPSDILVSYREITGFIEAMADNSANLSVGHLLSSFNTLQLDRGLSDVDNDFDHCGPEDVLA